MSGELLFAGVTFGYAGEERHAILKQFDARFDGSRITVLTGVSGCGKSSLLYLAAGIYPEHGGILHHGRVLVNGADPAALSPVPRCALTGMMFQNPPLQFCMDTVEHELAFCLENKCVLREELACAIDEALRFCGIAHLKAQRLITLSGGEQQMVMLACLICLSPKWILLDEPFANLDAASSRRIAEQLLRLHRERGVSILAVDHRLEHWMGIAGEIKVMDAHGRLVKEGLRPDMESAAELAAHGVDVPWIPYQTHRPEKPQKEQFLLTLTGLTVRYGERMLLNRLDAAFSAGRMYAVTGASGSGKTTLFQALRGLVPYTGDICFLGRPFRKRMLRRGRIGFVVQHPQDQFVADTVYDEVLLGLKHRLRPEEAAAEAERMLRGTGLWRYRRLSPYMLSQGQQRRLGVAALLSYDCALLICDEPTYAQDRSHTLAIMDALQDAVRHKGVTVIFSTHDRKLAREYADACYTLEGGTLHACP